MSGVDELAGQPIGRRIQVLRERRGKTRAVVAGLVGRSEEWLKAIERGRLQAPRLEMLIRIAEVLGISDLAELTGDPRTPFSLSPRAGHDSVPAVREAIEEMDLSTPPEPWPTGDELQRRAGEAWKLWHASPAPREAVGTVLPSLIRDGRRAVRVLEGADRRKAHAALSGAYALSEQLLAWVTDSALLWLAADRCMASAQQADDPEALAAAAWVLGNVWRATGREEDALALATDGAALLEPALGGKSDNPRALWGACQLHASLTAARLGREGDALRHLDRAQKMARKMPGGYAHPWTLFGTPNADLTEVSVHVDLRKSGKALDSANLVAPDSIPSLDRRARLWLETARAYAQKKDHPATLHTLQRATSISAEGMRCHPLARNLASELVTSGGRLVEREARSLAKTIGVAA